MKRREFLNTTGSLASIAWLFPAIPNVKIPTGYKYEMQHLRKNVGFFTERGGTIGWLITEEHVVVVDTQFPEQSGHLVDEIKKKGMRKVDLLINTHHHGDHTAGNIVYKELTHKIVAHQNSKVNQMNSAKNRGNEDVQLYPNELYTDRWSTKIGEETITLQYFGAAHTNGDSLVHFENANVVHMGDLIFNRRFPYIDKGAGASISNWIAVLAKALKYYDQDTLYIFGHASEGYPITGGAQDLKAMQNYLDKLLVYMKAELKKGKSLEELKNTKAIPGATEWTGRGIIRSIEAAYQELKEI